MPLEGWLKTWDERNQRAIEKENEGERRAARRHRHVQTSAGDWVTVTAVPRGQPARMGTPFGLAALAQAVLLLVAAAVHRLRYPDEWTVVVLAPATAWRGERLLFRDHVRGESTAEHAVARVAEHISDGRWPIERRRGRPARVHRTEE